MAKWPDCFNFCLNNLVSLMRTLLLCKLRPPEFNTEEIGSKTFVNVLLRVTVRGATFLYLCLIPDHLFYDEINSPIKWSLIQSMEFVRWSFVSHFGPFHHSIIPAAPLCGVWAKTSEFQRHKLIVPLIFYEMGLVIKSNTVQTRVNKTVHKLMVCDAGKAPRTSGFCSRM